MGEVKRATKALRGWLFPLLREKNKTFSEGGTAKKRAGGGGPPGNLEDLRGKKGNGEALSEICGCKKESRYGH